MERGTELEAMLKKEKTRREPSSEPAPIYKGAIVCEKHISSTIVSACFY